MYVYIYIYTQITKILPIVVHGFDVKRCTATHHAAPHVDAAQLHSTLHHVMFYVLFCKLHQQLSFGSGSQCITSCRVMAHHVELHVLN